MESTLTSRLTRWLLLDGSRFAVALLQLLGTFLVLVGLGVVGVIDVQNRAAVRGVATGFVPGLIAFLSIVLGINQLVLSQEFGDAGEIRERIRSVREYRQDVEAVAGTGPSPVLPVGFLTFVVGSIQSEATSLEECVDPETDPEVAEAVRGYARRVAAEATRARESLQRLRPGRINALLPVLEYDDTEQLLAARRLQYDHADELPREVRDSLGRLVETLELFAVARTQFRTTYTQRVLARLSRLLLYVGGPALVVVVVLGLQPTSGVPLGSSRAELLLVALLFTAALSPLAVLSAYLLRVAAVSERTIAAGPFVSRPGEARRSVGRDGAEAAGRSPDSAGGVPAERDER